MLFTAPAIKPVHPNNPHIATTGRFFCAQAHSHYLLRPRTATGPAGGRERIFLKRPLLASNSSKRQAEAAVETSLSKAVKNSRRVLYMVVVQYVEPERCTYEEGKDARHKDAKGETFSALGRSCPCDFGYQP